MGKSTHSTMAQIIDAGIAVRQHCHRDDEGHAVYENGWSDQRIVDETGATLSTVTSIRRKEFGNLPPRGNANATLEEVRQRVATLEERFDTIEAMASEVMERFPEMAALMLAAVDRAAPTGALIVAALASALVQGLDRPSMREAIERLPQYKTDFEALVARLEAINIADITDAKHGPDPLSEVDSRLVPRPTVDRFTDP